MTVALTTIYSYKMKGHPARKAGERDSNYDNHTDFFRNDIWNGTSDVSSA
jgi:hypothetical protein